MDSGHPLLDGAQKHKQRGLDDMISEMVEILDDKMSISLQQVLSCALQEPRTMNLSRILHQTLSVKGRQSSNILKVLFEAGAVLPESKRTCLHHGEHRSYLIRNPTVLSRKVPCCLNNVNKSSDSPWPSTDRTIPYIAFHESLASITRQHYYGSCSTDVHSNPTSSAKLRSSTTDDKQSC